jgi:hypothetical protein
LLHNWDQRRGIHSEFGFDEKLRTCREVALAMQAEDLAECDADEVQAIFAKVLDNPERAARLLEHIRYRTGLLLERRPDVFGFAHLTFQEYLAARAVHEGNRLGIDAERLVREHDDGRWKEVIALYSGLATAPVVRDVIECLIAQQDTRSLAEVLAEAYLSAGSELAQDQELRRRVLERVAIAPGSWAAQGLNRFPKEEVAPIAHALVGTVKSSFILSESHKWLSDHPELVEETSLWKRLQAWQSMTSIQVSELVHLLHIFASDEILMEIVKIPSLYTSQGPIFERNDIANYSYQTQGEIAFIGLVSRKRSEVSIPQRGFEQALRMSMQTLLKSQHINWGTLHGLGNFIERLTAKIITVWDINTKQEFALLARQLADHIETLQLLEEPIKVRKSSITALKVCANRLEGVNSKGKPSRKSVPVKSKSKRPKPRKR